jgi:hypothetical protein
MSETAWIQPDARARLRGLGWLATVLRVENDRVFFRYDDGPGEADRAIDGHPLSFAACFDPVTEEEQER